MAFDLREPAGAPSQPPRAGGHPAAMVRAASAVLAVALWCLASPPTGLAADSAARVLERLTPEQRAAQALLVAFFVPQPDQALEVRLADVRGLVQRHGLGGVVLQKGNNAFRNERGADLAPEIAAMANALQETALEDPAPRVPLFVAVDHEGDGDPLTHLREGFTALPSAMAVGATFDVDSAETIGRIAGAELAAVGVNMLLGPVLDVLDDPRVDSGGDIGTRSFGGDPYWVQLLGAAYVRGAHVGSGGRLAVVAKHFPGHGGSDRSTDNEVATVNKSLDALRQVELQPFAAVTAGAPGDPEAPHIADGLMTSHIRYRAVRPDIRSLTPPISFDREAMEALMALDGMPFAQWRKLGGLIVADSLGVRAVRRYFDPAGQTLPHREVARRALMAGNDVLILAQFADAGGWNAQLANIEDTIAFFSEQHRADPVFRRRLDDAVLRVLRAKLALYPSWQSTDVLVSVERATLTAGDPASGEAASAIARAAVTELRANERPRPGDRIVFVADFDRNANPRELACPDESCGMQPDRAARLSDAAPTLIEALLLDRYGPTGDDTVKADEIRLVTFCQLRHLLDPATPTGEEGEASADDPSACDPAATPDQVRQTLAEADWVTFVFAELDPTEVRDLRGFLLPQVQAIVASGRQPRLAALSLGPPYYVDQTNFYHLDAYYAAYSKIAVSVDAAVAALFGDLAPRGSLPVTYPDAGFELHELLAPDPAQVVGIRLVTGPDAAGPPARVVVEAGPLLDLNGHTVPDGTQVRFETDPAEAAVRSAPVVVGTAAGVARAELQLVQGGSVSIMGTSDRLALRPLVVGLDSPTPTPAPSGTTPVGRASDAASRAQPPQDRARRLGLVDFLLALAALMLVGLAASRSPLAAVPPRARARTALLSTGLGLATYLAYGTALRMLPAARPAAYRTGLDAAGAAAAGALAGLAVTTLLRARSKPPAPGPPG